MIEKGQMSYKEQIDFGRLPRHIAIIMDGNGRWAKAQGKDRIFGHTQGADSVRAVIEAACEIGIPYLSLYAFSTENFNRPATEVSALMRLFIESIERETEKLKANGIRCVVIGDLARLDEAVRQKAAWLMEETAEGEKLTLVLAIAYSSRWEIVHTANRLISEAANGHLPDAIDEACFSSHLETAGLPDPDLLIRTGGEQRISNFLLWQAAYAELLFTSTSWPEFRHEAFYQAVVDFQGRERRFGKTSEQIKENATE